MKEFLNQLVVIEESVDTRQQWKIKYRLSDIIFIVLVATLCNCDEWEEMELFAEYHIDTLRKYIELKNGIPGHDTIRRAMAMLNPQILQDLMNEWQTRVEAGEDLSPQKLIHIDGKTVRGNARCNEKPTHIVSAYCSDDGYTLGQIATDEKSNEITAIPELLKKINVKGNIVTIDAIGTQKSIVELIKKDCKADYVLSVKGNQPTLCEDLKDYFDIPEVITQLETNNDMNYLRTFEKAHGQLETREYYQTDAIKWLFGKAEWHGLKTIGMVKTTIVKENKTSIEKRFFISSLPLDVKVFAKSVRSYWSIESMHWHLDVIFREDANTTVNKVAVMNQNIIRKWALAIIKRVDSIHGKKCSLKTRRLVFSFSPAEMLERVL